MIGHYRTYQMCNFCVMDTSDPDIQFDEGGFCNHCRDYEARAAKELHYDAEGLRDLPRIIDRIKREGKNKPYDCIIGLSGGTDSSYVALKVVQWGLRPLAVSVDNGFDTEVSLKNVRNLVKKLDLKWVKFNYDTPQFHDLQLSFLKASVINAEAPTDHVITSLLYKMAQRHHIRWVITGGNVVTEAIMPRSWGHDAKDWRHVKAVQRQFGKYDISDLPHLNLWGWFYMTFVKRLKFFPILNWEIYVREHAKKELEYEVGWQDYGKKHLESVYTRLFQTYILPKKFGIDKRRPHLSTLICSGQMSRNAALAELEEPYYPASAIETDMLVSCAKLGISRTEFEYFMQLPPKHFDEYSNNFKWFNAMKGFVAFARRLAIAN